MATKIELCSRREDVSAAIKLIMMMIMTIKCDTFQRYTSYLMTYLVAYYALKI